MKNIRTTADADLRKTLTSYIGEMSFKPAFEDRYGRGWQRKLGAVLDVPETTVNGWFKSGKFPVLAKLAFGVLLSQAARPAQRWIPVKNGADYTVCDTHGPVGRIVAKNIASLDDALLIAAAPALREAGGDAFVVFDDARDDFADAGFGELADKLGAALDAAKYSRAGEASIEEQED